ncbi:ATP-binding protein [Kitasatospora atroaurantiaca]|uniref:Anti-sigma regulatory factor (Ser/Thr protein kinase) n=1 Tax=Kitasatospora atroaurantiaca TaxID=285545 RepID=A0A561EQP5_9ACTN|nr:ATP-binding protein [Kitasatospora atroaurantiaca]TWE17915.1 anti-sigma regulatory factor (Ser/Thr protein kinase) [Kitasatospora atroaurantiaca]
MGVIGSSNISGSGVTLLKPPNTVNERGYWLPRHRRSAGVARERLREFLADVGGGGQLLDAAESVLTELVTNAVEHARVSPGRLIAVRLLASDGRLRIEVHDASEERPVLRPEVGGDEESGRGLRLVELLAVAWGCCPRPGGVGKLVWAVVGPVEGGS